MEAQGQREAKLAKRIARELEWVRSSPKARQAKSKARLENYDRMVAEAKSGERPDVTDIKIPVGPRLGSKVIEANHLRKCFGDRVLIDDLSFSLPRNGIVGVIGPNGVGKTTLFKMIMGMEDVTDGSLEIGETVQISYVDQNRAGIDAQKNVWEVVSDGNDWLKVGDTEIQSRAYVAAFGFKGPDQQKPAGVLSGGERNRLNLALTLKQGGNLLLLDEPTNDLDVETLESLEEALLGFPGCAVITSHDRYVPRPHRHAHPGMGGHRREPGPVALVRGQLRGLPQEQGGTPGRRGRQAPPPAPQAHPRLSANDERDASSLITHGRAPRGPSFLSGCAKCYSCVMAPVGHSSVQTPHSMQESGSATVETPSWTSSTSHGHASAHAPQPMQTSVSTVGTAMISSDLSSLALRAPF